MATAVSKTITVQGFHCTGCSDNLGSSLSNLDGVIRARADYDAGQVEVRFDPDRVSEDDVFEQIRTAGFEPV
ncbi:MAG: hypothetical protein BMS9Abin07_2125 [Acidimicrobiia bacterium]|nr:MAG: hypothetical protein BMS9Abin07_2125 [Acidimicrobiia bacterium]